MLFNILQTLLEKPENNEDPRRFLWLRDLEYMAKMVNFLDRFLRRSEGLEQLSDLIPTKLCLLFQLPLKFFVPSL